jgi:tetratricopeptide (TPR) repeat protein
MSEPFLSSDDYDERAHQLYNEGQYDEAVETLRLGLGLYPHAVELHVGMGYARLAREEYLWARRAFEESVGLDPEHEDALAGLGEVLLKFGDRSGAVACFDRILALGFKDDHDLMLQIGRALFREAALDQARRFFQLAITGHAESSEAAACAARSSSTPRTRKRASISRTCCTTAGNTKQRCFTSSAPRRATTSTGSPSGG